MSRAVALAGILLVGAAAGCTVFDAPCADCVPARAGAVQPVSEVEAAGIPWRHEPAEIRIEVHATEEGIAWRMDEPGAAEAAGVEAVQIVLRDAAGRDWTVDDPRLEGSYMPEPGLEVTGVRAIRAGRVGRLFSPTEPGDLEQALLPVPRWNRPSPFDESRLAHGAKRYESAGPIVRSGHDNDWDVVSLAVSMEPQHPGLVGEVVMTLEARADVEALSIAHIPGEATDIAVSPEPGAMTQAERELSLTFDPPLDLGEHVALDFQFAASDLGDLAIHPAYAASRENLFFFSPRGPLIPAPDGTLAAAMPLTLDLTLPEGWHVASNLEAVATNGTTRLQGGWPVRGRPAVVAGAFERSIDLSGDVELEALGLPSEDGLGDLDDYVRSFADTAALFTTWGALTQPRVSVAAVTPEHGGSAHYGLVMVPDFTYHLDRTRARDFFLAHELSHQWWGAIVWPASSLDLWLTEGLADYAALRALEVLRSEMDADEIWQENLALLIHLMAEGYGGAPGRDVPVRPERAADLQDYVYYLKGSWVLRHLEALVGRPALDRALAAYYAGAIHATASTDDFVVAVEAEAEESLSWFWEQWLSGTGLPEIVFAPYFHPDDPDDFEIVITQVGDRPFPDEAWRLPLQLTVGDRVGWVCMTDRQQGFSAGDLSLGGPLEACSP